MTIITGSDAGGAWASRDLGGSNRHSASTQGRQKGMNAYPNFDFSEEALLAGERLSDGEAQGGEEQTSRRETPDKERRGDEDADRNRDSVLAMAVGLQAASVAQAPALSAAQPIDVDAGGAAQIDQIMLRIEQAVRASLHGGDGAPQAFKVRLDDLQIPGLNALHVSMSASALDVSLGRDAGALTPQIMAAAQSLAGQLAVRFPTRVVRVLDLDVGSNPGRDDPASLWGMRAISDLLARGAK